MLPWKITWTSNIPDMVNVGGNLGQNINTTGRNSNRIMGGVLKVLKPG